IVGGQVRLVDPKVESNGAELVVAGSVDLADAAVDLTLTLTGATAGDVAGRPAISVVLKGPIAAPSNTINTASMARCLALRAAERQSKRLDAIESARRPALAQPLSDQPLPAFEPATPVARHDDNDDQASPQTQKQAQPAQSATEASPNTAESTGGIAGSTQIPPQPTGGIAGRPQFPPLPPPIVIDPITKN